MENSSVEKHLNDSTDTLIVVAKFLLASLARTVTSKQTSWPEVNIFPLRTTLDSWNICCCDNHLFIRCLVDK